MDAQHCFLATTDFEETRQYLLDLPLDELIFMTGMIIDELTPVEQLHFDINNFCTSFDDKVGRIRFIENLVEQGIIQALQIPVFYGNDPKMRNLQRPIHYDFFFAQQQQQQQPQQQQEEELPQTASALSVKNPRWEHVDEYKKQKNPQKVAVDDEILLKVDISGFAEGARMTFDIYDTSENPPLRIDTANGTHSQGIGSAKWTVKDPNEKGLDLKLEFEGIAKSLASPRTAITVEMKEFTFSF